MASLTSSNMFTRGFLRITRRNKKMTLHDDFISNQMQSNQEENDIQQEQRESKGSRLFKNMNRLRRSLRLPRRRDRSVERNRSESPAIHNDKKENWVPDESLVRSGNCSFHVKYLGAVEVFESRGMQVCEGALKTLRNSKRKPIKAVLYVSGDGLRVVDQGNSRGLLVDQTIEKVSFCAPDRNSERGFAYICRDGSARRWMCHGFLSIKDTGERLSHAVGCAFSICLEKKKKRDEENAASSAQTLCNPSTSNSEASSSSIDNKGITNNSRSNLAYQSFRKQVPMESRYLDPQSVIISDVPASSTNSSLKFMAKPRPAANPSLFSRNGSLRAPDQSHTNRFIRSSLRDDSFSRVNHKTLHNEPIYEGDEDPLCLGLATPKTALDVNNPVKKNGLDGLDLMWNAKPAPMPSSSLINNEQVSFANWTETKLENQSSPLDDIQKQFEQASTANASEMKHSASKEKADEWLEDVLKVSLTLSPHSEKSNPISVSDSLDSKMSQHSGPPPSYAPPPLPSKQAVSKVDPSVYNTTPLNTQVNWFPENNAHTQVLNSNLKPADPFDVHWNTLAIADPSKN